MTTFNVARTLRHHADRTPERPALVFAGTTTSYGELDAAVDRFAAALRRRRVVAGDVVAIVAGNRPEYVVAAYAAARLGAILLPLNWRLAAPELRFAVEHSGAKAIVVDRRFQATAEEALRTLEAVTVRVLLDEPPAAGEQQWEGWTTLAEEPTDVVVDAECDQDTPHVLMYTSGTTSTPKGVVLTHGNAFVNSVCHGLEFGLRADDRILVAAPLFHVSGLLAMAESVVHAGGCIVLLDTPRAPVILDLITSERLTGLGFLAGPTVLDILASEQLDDVDASAVRFVITAVVPPRSWQAWRRRFPDMHLSYGYGMTELCSGSAYSERAIADDPAKFGSMGKPFAFHDVKIVDERGDEVAVGEPGEMIWRGPKVCAGYWREPELTAATIRDGWLHTGDIGRIDADGHVYFVDRIKDMIKTGGENVASAEIEAVLAAHPHVLDVAVVGVPDDRWGEVPRAFVVGDGTPLDPAELAAHCAASLARFKIPKQFETVAVLPRNESGKVLKRELRDR